MRDRPADRQHQPDQPVQPLAAQQPPGQKPPHEDQPEAQKPPQLQPPGHEPHEDQPDQQKPQQVQPLQAGSVPEAGQGSGAPVASSQQPQAEQRCQPGKPQQPASGAQRPAQPEPDPDQPSSSQQVDPTGPQPSDPEQPTSASVAVSAAVLRGLRCCSDPVAAVLAALAALADQPVTAGLLPGEQLADDVTGLARVRAVLDAELARRVHAATAADVLESTARTVLADAGVPAGAGWAIRTAGAFTARFPHLQPQLATGAVGVDAVAAIASLTRRLSDTQAGEVVDTLLPHLPRLSLPAVKTATQAAVDLLRPTDADAREQDDWDRRNLSYTSHGGIWEFAATLPELEAQALLAALNAVADSLRGAEDTSTVGQRRADALMTIVAQAAANNTLPTSHGMPAAALIGVGLSEAERVAAGRARQQHDTLADAAAANGGSPPARVIGSDTTLGDAAVRFLTCAAAMTGMLVKPLGEELASPLATALGLAPLQPLDQGRAKRCFTDAQRKAIALRDITCVKAGCTIPANQCETHHVGEWAAGGATDLHNGASLCWVHHREVDLGRWLVTRNPHPSPGSYWTTTPLPRHRWRRRT